MYTTHKWHRCTISDTTSLGIITTAEDAKKRNISFWHRKEESDRSDKFWKWKVKIRGKEVNQNKANTLTDFDCTKDYADNL